MNKKKIDDKTISELKTILIELRYIARQYSKLSKKLIALLKKQNKRR
jgi:hypothetical protein